MDGSLRDRIRKLQGISSRIVVEEFGGETPVADNVLLLGGNTLYAAYLGIDLNIKDGRIKGVVETICCSLLYVDPDKLMEQIVRDHYPAPLELGVIMVGDQRIAEASAMQRQYPQCVRTQTETSTQFAFGDYGITIYPVSCPDFLSSQH